MKSPIAWTVGRRLTAIAGIGIVSTVAVGAVALQGLTTLNDLGAEAGRYQNLNTAMQALDTRASELKADAYLAVSSPDPESVVADAQEDVGKLMGVIDAIEENATDEESQDAENANFRAAFEEYGAAVVAFTEQAAQDQERAAAGLADIQAANSGTDELLEGYMAAIGAAGEDAVQKQSDTRSRTITFTLVAAVLGVLSLAVLAWMIARSITRPLRSSIDVLAAFAGGDLTQRAEERSAAELGELERALNRSMESVGGIIDAVAGSADAVAAASEQLSSSSQQIAAGAEETSVQAGVVSGAAEEVSRNVGTVAAGSEQMGASIREIAHSANEAARVASQAVSMVDST
ncbi:HAMP domain-containing protein, partial [Nocardioides ferulae]|uniref:HAMP domain-containing protein n=1 Tax=Nocardioides ferulae TaxID=2340821 RepID=UPI0013DE70AD